jgi:regulator of sigma D
MKLIIEKINDEIYAYTETEKQFKHNECCRATRPEKPSILDIECNLGMIDENLHIVFDIAPIKRKKKTT